MRSQHGFLYTGMNYIFRIVGVLAAISLSAFAYSHSGGTNADGCHRNHSTGGYHCHNSRAPGAYERQMEGLAQSDRDSGFPFWVIAVMGVALFVGNLIVKKHGEIDRKVSHIRREGSLRNKVNYPNGDVYTGDVKDGKPHGKGVLVKGRGSLCDYFEGEWSNGEMHGEIRYRQIATGEVYERRAEFGHMPAGSGRCRFRSGNEYVGCHPKSHWFLFGPGQCELIGWLISDSGVQKRVVVKVCLDKMYNWSEIDAIISAEAYRYTQYGSGSEWKHVRKGQDLLAFRDAVNIAQSVGYSFVESEDSISLL